MAKLQESSTILAHSAAKTTDKRTKPKRPLSGYNLFYRYKRNKVLEATAQLPSRKLSEKDEKAHILSILTTLPGLEGIPPTHFVWTYPLHARDEFRASNIRCAMEGKLLPNKNVRNRRHCKVHGLGGLGFVEMGRVMHKIWASIDKFTKTVFNELADVGRMRYRTLKAEYKLSSPQEQSASPKQSQVTSKTMRQVKSVNLNDTAPFVASNDTGAATYPMNIHETPEATKKPSDFSFTSTIATSSFGTKVVMAVPTAMGPKNSLRRFGSQSSFESMSVDSVGTSHNSTVITPSVSTADDFSIGSYDDIQQLLSILPPPSEESFLESTSQGGGIVSTQEPSPFPISNIVIGNSFHCEDKAALASNSHSFGAQDFLDLLSTLDEALDK